LGNADGRSVSPRSDEDQGGDGEGQGSGIHSYDAVHRLIEQEEARKREIDRRLSELDAHEREARERLAAAKARNAERERDIAELQLKVQSLEGAGSGAGAGAGAGAGLMIAPGGSATTDDLGSRPSRGSGIGGGLSMPCPPLALLLVFEVAYRGFVSVRARACVCVRCAGYATMRKPTQSSGGGMVEPNFGPGFKRNPALHS
jgi:hypothetical protein